MKLRLQADYECFPSWALEEDGLRNFDPAELPIPAALAEDIRAWARRYEATYDRADPASSGFPSCQDEEGFDREGRRLRAALKEALGTDHQVAYFSVLSGWEGGE